MKSKKENSISFQGGNNHLQLIAPPSGPKVSLWSKAPLSRLMALPLEPFFLFHEGQHLSSVEQFYHPISCLENFRNSTAFSFFLSLFLPISLSLSLSLPPSLPFFLSSPLPSFLLSCIFNMILFDQLLLFGLSVKCLLSCILWFPKMLEWLKKQMKLPGTISSPSISPLLPESERQRKTKLLAIKPCPLSCDPRQQNGCLASCHAPFFFFIVYCSKNS